MDNTVNLKSEPAIAVVGELSNPLQAPRRRANELLPKLNEAVRGYSIHMVSINTASGGVKHG